MPVHAFYVKPILKTKKLHGGLLMDLREVGNYERDRMACECNKCKALAKKYKTVQKCIKKVE